MGCVWCLCLKNQTIALNMDRILIGFWLTGFGLGDWFWSTDDEGSTIIKTQKYILFHYFFHFFILIKINKWSTDYIKEMFQSLFFKIKLTEQSHLTMFFYRNCRSSVYTQVHFIELSLVWVNHLFHSPIKHRGWSHVVSITFLVEEISTPLDKSWCHYFLLFKI